MKNESQIIDLAMHSAIAMQCPGEAQLPLESQLELLEKPLTTPSGYSSHPFLSQQFFAPVSVINCLVFVCFHICFPIR